MNPKVKISVDCICDLPRKLQNELNISIMYFYIQTEEGRFQDIAEVNSKGIIEYLEQGKQVRTSIASLEEYEEYFKSIKEECNVPIIHICAAKYVSHSYEVALQATQQIDDIYIIDSGQLSGGISIMALTAAEMAAAGADYELILKELEIMKDKVCTSFVVDTTQYLYRNQKVNKFIVRLCDIFPLHPILELVDSKMCISGVCIGEMKYNIKGYVRRILKKPQTIDTDIVFIISAGCSTEFIEAIKEEVKKKVNWKQIIVNSSSATVSSNCGPGSFGVLFMRKTG